jgi:hypothetical protein
MTLKTNERGKRQAKPWRLKCTMAFACVLPGPSGDDSNPRCAGVDRDGPYRHPSLCGGVNNGDVSATAVSLCRLQQALKRDPHAGDLFMFRGRRGNLVLD